MPASRKRIIVEVLRESLARLADVAPTHIVLWSEANDWAMLGDDFAHAMTELKAEEPILRQQEPHDKDEELVEA